jgi:hypothetical protein
MWQFGQPDAISMLQIYCDEPYYGNNTPSDDEPLLDYSINAWQTQLPVGHWIGIADADASRYGAPALDLSPSLHVILGR